MGIDPGNWNFSNSSSIPIALYQRIRFILHQILLLTIFGKSKRLILYSKQYFEIFLEKFKTLILIFKRKQRTPRRSH